jgi:hypothetical protein
MTLSTLPSDASFGPESENSENIPPTAGGSRVCPSRRPSPSHDSLDHDTAP